jgi:hypothetical protein
MGCFIYRSTTLELVQEIRLNRGMYTGGLLMHRNGNAYAIHSNQLFKFHDLNLENVTTVSLPTKLNGNVVLTNGMLVTQDGYIIVKQWSFNAQDILMFSLGKKIITQILVAFVAGAVGILLYVTKSPTGIPLGALVGFALWFILVLLVFVKLMGPFNPIRFVMDGIYSSNIGGGELKIIDPITLQVIAGISLPERCSYARMALTKVPFIHSEGRKEDAIVLLGDEFIHQLRWNVEKKELSWVSMIQNILISSM